MSPSASGMSPAAAPLPPLPDLPPGGQSPSQGGGMASLVSGLAPIKSAVDQILKACQVIVQSGSIPGAEQPCGQIVALATSLLPTAVTQALHPGPQQGSQPQGQGINPVGM